MTAENHNFLEEIFLSNTDADKCLSSLSKLSRHFEKTVVLTGSIASGLHLSKKGLQQKKRLNDIDMVVEDLADVRASISKDFLINHFHPFRERGKVLLQLVDEENGVRIEIFTANSKTLTERLVEFKIADLHCQAVAVEDVLAKLLSILYSINRSEAVDPKYVEHFRLLLKSADLTTARKIWQDYRKEPETVDFDEAVEKVKQSLATNPNLLQPEKYCQNINFSCQWCCESESFPVSDRTKIYEILGYV